MKRTIIYLIYALLLVVEGVHAQSKQDSLFLQKFNPGTELVKGKSYVFETDKQHSSPEYGKSMLVKADADPEFDMRGDIVNGEPFASFKNKILVFKETKQDKVKIGEKEYLCLVIQFTCDGKKYNAYEIQYANPRVCAYYDLVDADFLNEIRKQLVGKTLYTRSAKWWKYNEDKLNSNHKYQKVSGGTCKYCPVTITRVENDYDEKFVVLFRREGQNDEYCFDNVIFNSKKMGSFLSFDTYFTFENPQNKYPEISQERWEQIMSQKVKQGFTPEEVKVAFGDPDEKYTENDDETWVYYNKNGNDYAISFKDNIVDKVRSQTSNYY